jgi:hypothetical protein
MKTTLALTVLLASMLTTIATPVHAAGQLTREQVEMDRDTFLSLMRWDEGTGQWVLKSGMAPPKGVLSRSEVINMRDEWLRTHRYDEPSGSWVTIGAPRDMSSLTREQVNMETLRFLMMYRFDEGRSEWVSKVTPAR